MILLGTITMLQQDVKRKHGKNTMEASFLSLVCHVYHLLLLRIPAREHEWPFLRRVHSTVSSPTRNSKLCSPRNGRSSFQVRNTLVILSNTCDKFRVLVLSFLDIRCPKDCRDMGSQQQHSTTAWRLGANTVTSGTREPRWVTDCP